MTKTKTKINRKFIIIVECIIIAIILGFIVSNFFPKEEENNNDNTPKETTYLNGRYYIKDICENTSQCEKTIGKMLIGDKTYDLHLKITAADSRIKAGDQEIYNVDNTSIDYIEMIDNKYLLVHQSQPGGTYHTDLYDEQFYRFFHIISRQVDSQDTDMWIEGHTLYYYDYNCSNTDKRYATKFSINLDEGSSAPILVEETYNDDYMPNCSSSAE